MSKSMNAIKRRPPPTQNPRMVWTLLVDNIGTPFSSSTHEDANFVKRQPNQINIYAGQQPSFHWGKGVIFFLLCMDRQLLGKNRIWTPLYITWEYSKRLGAKHFIHIGSVEKWGVIMVFCPSSYILLLSHLGGGRGEVLFLLFPWTHGPAAVPTSIVGKLPDSEGAIGRYIYWGGRGRGNSTRLFSSGALLHKYCTYIMGQ